MSTVLTTARKELRAYFMSPVALMFLGVFLLVTLFVFFTSERFFARNIADVRPLFAWLPVLLVFLVAAITMRGWSEEEKIGTLEILMTLPVKTSELVLGKFIAGMALVALALALTLPLAVTVAILGDLDWGPVAGGYVGAMLLGATYMAIGLCVSSRTDNQIVSLMVTAVVCGVLYLIGSDVIVGFFGDRGGQFLRALGSGSRFTSIERGVLDLRDLVYYGSLTVFFLVLNVHFLELKRLETSTEAGRSRATSRWATIALVALNVFAVNLWLAPVTGARADLTENGEYSVSDSTAGVLARLEEPLRVSGYFSDRTHPLLAPLVPQIRDLLTEYQVVGRGKVQVEFLNPNEDEELEEELAQTYDIRTVPFRVTGRHEESVVNSYFHLLLRYADQYKVLTFNDLVEIHASDMEVDVRLRNLEYDLTRAIKKLSQGFQNVESLFAGLTDPAKLTVYVTPETLPEEFAEVPDRIRKVADELTDQGQGRFAFEEIDPSGDSAIQQQIAADYGFRPLAVTLFGGDFYYLYMLFESGQRKEAIYLQGDLTEASIRSTIEASIKRSAPGFLKTIALMTEKPVPPPANPNIPPQFQPPVPQPDYRSLEQVFAEDFAFKRTELDDGVVPGDVDVLIVAKPGSLDDKQRFAIDQYLMRGGAVLALVGAHEVRAERGALATTETDAGLREMLEGWGVKIDDAFVLDSQNARFPVPIQERRGQFSLQRIHYMDYPFFPDIRRDGFEDGHVALAGLQNVVFNWGSALEITGDDDVETEILITSPETSWRDPTTTLLPATLDEADTAFPPSGERKPRPLAAARVGRFDSYFADKPSPLFGADAGDGEEADRTGRTLKESTPDARLVVVGSSAFASDLVKSLGDQMGGGVYRNNFQLVRNLVDWALEDTDLLKIRGTGAFARTLRPLDESDRSRWEFVNYALVLVALAGVVAIAMRRRRYTRPIGATGGAA